MRVNSSKARASSVPFARDPEVSRLLLAEGHLTGRLFGSMLRKIAALPLRAAKHGCS
jgi:hypothetical protein